MKHIDLFSGYGGFTIPGEKYGIETVAFSEIDKYASSVLAFNFPHIKNYGDITKIDFRQFNGEVDLITGGTPCQDLSVAGKQAGLSGARSGLFFEYIRAIREVNPRYFIWENVKGALSSSRGWDFARVQIEMEQAGYSVEWVVYNAKDFGVPQNRERIFAIGTRGESRREVLPEPTSAGQTLKELTKGMSQGYRVYDSSGVATAQAGQAGDLGAKTGLYAVAARNRGSGKQAEVNGTETANSITTVQTDSVVAIGSLQKNAGIMNNISPSLTKAMGDGGGHIPMVTAIDLCETAPKLTDEVRTIQARYHKGYSNRKAETSGVLVYDDYNSKVRTDGNIGSLTTNIGNQAPRNGTKLIENMRIRRLTPVECERLMGLPDGWTSKGIIDGKEVETSDTQRYKMCGNGVVVNVVDFIYSILFS